MTQQISLLYYAIQQLPKSKVHSQSPVKFSYFTNLGLLSFKVLININGRWVRELLKGINSNIFVTLYFKYSPFLE